MTLGDQLKVGLDSSETSVYKQNKIEQLFTAVESGEQHQIRALLNSGVDVNTRDSYGYTPLMTAIENNNIKSCKLLVEFGADINCKDNDGETPLTKAVLTESIEIVEFLIQKGACINETDKLGETALMKAARCNLREIGNFLLMENAKYNLINCEGKTARDIAIKKWGINSRNFFLDLPIKNVDMDLLKKKSIYLINKLNSNNKHGFRISLSEFKREFEKKYDEKIDDDIIKKSLDYISEHICEQGFYMTILNEEIIECPDYDKKIYKIISVEIVAGNKLMSTWKSPMQIVKTDRGKFIDNIPNNQYGFFGRASSGFKWSTLIGTRTTNVKIFRSRGYDWINYTK